MLQILLSPRSLGARKATFLLLLLWHLWTTKRTKTTVKTTLNRPPYALRETIFFLSYLEGRTKLIRSISRFYFFCPAEQVFRHIFHDVIVQKCSLLSREDGISCLFLRRSGINCTKKANLLDIYSSLIETHCAGNEVGKLAVPFTCHLIQIESHKSKKSVCLWLANTKISPELQIARLNEFSGPAS